MKKNIAVLLFLSVFTSISAQQTSSIEQGQSVISLSIENGNDSIYFSSASYDGEEAIYFPDSLFQDNGDGTRIMLLDGKQLKDKLLKVPGVKKDEEGNYITPNGRVLKTLVVRKGAVRSDSIITRKPNANQKKLQTIY